MAIKINIICAASSYEYKVDNLANRLGYDQTNKGLLWSKKCGKFHSNLPGRFE